MQFWRKIINIADKLVNGLILLFFVPLLLYGVYALWDAQQVYKQADGAVYQTYRPTADADQSFEELRQVNPEVFGWLSIEDTNIDYPLVQAENNSKYVNTDVNGAFSLAGSIFLDYHNDKSFTDVNHVIYGHHMQKDAMFGELEQFGDQTYFDEHPRGEIFYDGEWHNIDFFAFVATDAYDAVLFNTELDGAEGNKIYLDYVKEHAQNFRPLYFSAEEHYIALSTCTSDSTNGRHILIGRITDQ